MFTITHWLTIGAAFLAAIVLLLLGRRTLTLPDARKRPTLFLAALMFFLATYGVTLSSADESVTRPPVTADKKASSPKLPPELSSPEQWAAFKTLWDELAAVSPRLKTERDAAGHQYHQILSAEDAQDFRKKLAGCLGVDAKDLPAVMARSRAELSGGDWDGRDVKTLSPVGLALANVTLGRIDYMERGDQTPMTRMVMPMSAHAWDIPVIEDLEKRLDTLSALRSSDKIKSDEYAVAIQGIRNDVYLYAVLYTLQIPRRTFGFSPMESPAVRQPQQPKVETLTRMKARPRSLQPLTSTDKKLAEVHKRIETLKQLKADRKIADTEYKASMQTLQKEVRDLLYFDPTAWIRGFEQAYKKQVDSTEGDRAAEAAMYRQVKTMLAKLEAARPSLDAAVKKLEDTDQTGDVSEKAS